MPPTDVRPFINGHRYSHSSIEIVAKGLRFHGVTQIAYGSSLEPGEVRGDDTTRIGRTPGEAKHRGELEMYSKEARALLDALGPGWGLQRFDVWVAFDEREKYEDNAEPPEGVKMDRLVECRITNNDLQSAVGPDGTTMRFTLDPWTIAYGRDDMTIDGVPTSDVPETIEVEA